MNVLKNFMKNKPTLKDFEFFKKCCFEFADKWELNNWTFRFHFEKDKNDKFEGGKIIRYLDTFQAEIYLDANYLTDKEDIKQIVKFVSENKKDYPELSITVRAAGCCMSGGSLNESIINTLLYLTTSG